MAHYAREEIMSSSDVVRNFGSVLSSVVKHQREKVAIIRNNRLEAVLVAVDVYERLEKAGEIPLAATSDTIPNDKIGNSSVIFSFLNNNRLPAVSRDWEPNMWRAWGVVMTRKIYLDSCIAIYLVEEHPIYAASVENTLSECDGIVCYSPLTELECTVLPLRQKRVDILEKFSGFFLLNLKLEMSDLVYKEATRLRAEFGIKTPDALHLATATVHNCTDFWTNDNRLAGVANRMVINVIS
jgi:uncharacterized protein